MNVLSLHALIATGQAGLAASTAALAALGHTTWAVPTALFSNHPAQGAFAGRMLPTEAVSELLAGIAARGSLAECAAVAAGFLGTPETAALLLDAVERVKTANANALFLCDATIGEAGRVALRPGMPEFYRDRALGRTDLLVVNGFTLAFLTGASPTSMAEATAAAQELRGKLRPGGPRAVLAMGLDLAFLPQQSAVLLAHQAGALAVATPLLAAPPPGVADVLAGLLLGHWLNAAAPAEALSRAVSAAHALADAAVAAGQAELPLVAQAGLLAAPPLLWPAETVG
jgi:pyridoxine kinase